MFKLFGKKTSVKDNKINAEEVFVDVDGKKVSLATLQNSFEKGEKLDLLCETDEVVVNGKKVSVKTLVNAYRQNDDKKMDDDKKDDDDKKKDDDKKDDDDKKKDDDKEEEEIKNSFCRNCGKKLMDDDKKDDKKCDDALCNECFPKKKDDGKDEEEKKDDDKKEKNDEKPLPNPQTDEGDTAVKKNSKEFFMDLENAKLDPKHDNEMSKGDNATREDKAERGKRIFGSKKKK
jgi:hypothetical protein